MLGAARHFMSKTHVALLCNCEREPVNSRHSLRVSLELFFLVLALSFPNIQCGLFHSGNDVGQRLCLLHVHQFLSSQGVSFGCTAQLSCSLSHVNMSYLTMYTPVSCHIQYSANICDAHPLTYVTWWYLHI